MIWLYFQECTGCTETLLRTSHPDVADLVFNYISLHYHETLMAAAGEQAEAALKSAMKQNAGKYVCIVKGAIPTKENGNYCRIAGKTAIDMVKKVAGSAALVVAIVRARRGRIPSADLNPTGAEDAPRFEGRPMQVGPLSQILVGYAAKHPLTVKWTDKALATVSALSGKPVTVNMLQSTMGRILARAIRAAIISDLALKHWGHLVDNIASGDTAIFNEPVFPIEEILCAGFHEAPRGTLSHWSVIKDGKITNQQAVVPTTWNTSPCDEHNTKGLYETSIAGNPVADPTKPLEVLRTIHSFDPCLACAVHTYDASGNQVATVQTLHVPVEGSCDR